MFLRINYLLIVSLLVSCSTVDYKKEPFRVSEDKIENVTFHTSNRMSLEKPFHNGFYIYIGEKEGQKWMRLVVDTIGDGSLQFNQLTFKCGDNKPIRVQKKSLENWSKKFDVSCSQYGCTTK